MRHWYLSLSMGGVWSAGWIELADQKPLIQSDKYQWRKDTIFSWWWAHGCPKHVGKRNKYIKQNCAPSWIYLRDYTGMHGQQNRKLWSFFNLGARCGWVFNTTLRPLYPRERPGTLCTGGWVGPRAGLDGSGKSRPYKIRSPDRLARIQSLYRPSYPGK